MTDAGPVLGIETSGRPGSVALLRSDGGVIESVLTDTGRGNAKSLVAEIARLLKEAGLRPGDIGTVAVSTGPGSFTGLRVGVVAAKTFARATGAILVAVDTFDAHANAVPSDVTTVTVVDDAHRGDVFVARYARRESGMTRIGEVAIVAANEWIDGLRPDEVLTGPGCTRFADRIAGRCAVVDPTRHQASAATIAELGLRLAERGETADPVALEPRYLRRSSAEVMWDERRPSP